MAHAPTIDELVPAHSRDQLLDDPLGLLTAAVRVATSNPTATAREGQASLRHHIDEAMQGLSHLVGVAPTGSGKSLATLTAAFDAAILRDERTVISTDSLALMGQLQDKDVDTVQRASSQLHPDRDVTVAFLKGVSNYVDPAKTIATAQTLTRSTSVGFAQLADELDANRPLHGLDQYDRVTDHELLRALVIWALRQYTSTTGPRTSGERHSCPIEHDAAMWETVSSPSSEADDGARYGVRSKAELAKDAAEAADIIITNHSILAVQAAHAIPVIIGSSRFGRIDHIIVDEAHTLPSHVRAQGSSKLSGPIIESISRQASRALGSPGGKFRQWADEGARVAAEVESALNSFTHGQRDGARRLGQNDDPFGRVGALVKQWAEVGSRMLANDSSSDVARSLKISAAADRLDTLLSALNAFSRHRTGWARWVDRAESRAGGTGAARSWSVANVAPINVGWMLNDNLWTAPDVDGDEGARYPLSVTAISATLPSNYPQQAGLAAQRRVYPTPFADAYARSALFIPSAVSPADLAALTSIFGANPRAKFDAGKHASWAVDHVVDLVRANGGKALVLAAKAADGRMYAERLRSELPHIQVHSQWDGGSPSRITTQWRDDEGSVLVGTKSLMTGVDAPGETCSLVIIDRVPRSPSNPIDDARVDDLNERLGDRWAADRFVYAVDAALLLDQASGRLVRATSDTGMVACLDPRLLKAPGGRPGPLTYPEPTRQVYMAGLYQFGVKIAAKADALEWLAGRK